MAQAKIDPGGTADWRHPVPEAGPGVYIITIDNPPIAGQPVIYIGRSKCLSKRLRQFYRHKPGAPAPHRGGQTILNLSGTKTVYWAPAVAYADAERVMLEAFHAETGGWPFGNRMKSTRMKPIPN